MSFEIYDSLKQYFIYEEGQKKWSVGIKCRKVNEFRLF